MESNPNKFSLTGKGFRNIEEDKGTPKPTILNFLNKDASQSKLSPLSSIVKSTNLQYKNINDRLSVTSLSQIKSPPFIKSESKTEFDNTDTPIHLPPDTPADNLQRKLPSLNATASLLKPIPSVKQPMNPSEMDYLGGGVNNIGSLIKTDKNNFLGTGSNINNFTQIQTIEGGSRPPQAEPTLQNIVSTCDLKCRLDLKTIALNARNTEYNPKRFAAAIMKIRNPKTTALIFSSGKMVCTGAKSEENSKKAAKKYAKTIKNMGFDVRFTDFKVQNIVASADVGFAIRLESLSHKHAEFCQYEPEIFPGLIYRIYSPKVVVLIFVSGKIVLTGAKTREQIQEAYNSILPALQMHKKDDSNMTHKSSLHIGMN